MIYSLEDFQYLENAFDRLYDIGGSNNGGVTRLGYSKEEDEMHAVFSALGKAMNLKTYCDQAGNTFIAYGREDRDYYLIGSHLDSVVDGGRYDGVAGILAGLLILRWAINDGIDIPIRIVALRCEESSNFGVCTLGSSLITNSSSGLDLSILMGKDGQTLGKIFTKKNYTLNPAQITGVKHYLELHIEQGRVLEENKQQIGIVTTIAGPRRFNLYIQGLAEHSGATPMNMRNDALCAAAELILAIEKIGQAESVNHSVATVSVINNQPNALNVIPGSVQLQVDTRGIDVASLDRMEYQMKQAGKAICQRRGAGFIKEKFCDARPVDMDKTIQERFAGAANKFGISYRQMISGAGHDAMNFSKLFGAALLLIPCKNGISHNKNEFANMDSICSGARVLYEYLKEEYVI